MKVSEAKNQRKVYWQKSAVKCIGLVSLFNGISTFSGYLTPKATL